MERFICLLRGVNVGGVKVKMDILRKSLEELGLENVKSYIQSGNLVFRSKGGGLIQKIEAKIEEVFGYRITVMLYSLKDFMAIVDRNPLVGLPNQVYISFLLERPLDYNENAVIEKMAADEEVVFKDDAIYLHCPSGYGQTKVHNNFLESKLKVKATTRNRRTCEELIKLAEGLE